MATIGTEPWTATSTTAWPSQWALGVNQGGANGASVASSLGRLNPNGSGYKVVRRIMSGIGASSAKRRTTGTFKLSAVGEGFLWLGGREVVGTTDYYATGYAVQLAINTGQWTPGVAYGSGYFSDAPTQTIAMVAGNTYGFTIDVDTFTIAARIWNITAGQTEPTTWQATWTDTDGSFPTGVPSLSIGSGNTVTQYVDFGPITVTDGAASATTTGYVKRREGTAWVRRRVLVFDGTNWVARPVKFRASDGTWRRSNS